jgi:L-malate glycosyltransferase
MSMNGAVIGMAGPIALAEFREHLHPRHCGSDLPKGLGGTPVNLLSRELLRRGRRLVIFTLDPAVNDEMVLEGESLRICVGPLRPTRARDFFSVERDYLLRAIGREAPDILHAQWTYEYALAAQKSGLPHVITAHDAPITILRLNLIPYRIARTLMAYRAVMRARRVVSVSPYVLEHIRRFMFYSGSEEVIPNGLPQRLFQFPVPPRHQGKAVVFATVLTGWNGCKNGQVAIEAFAYHRRHHPGDRLMMFGYGHGPGERAETFAQNRGLAEGIEFVGQRPYEEVLSRLASEADVLVHPSLEESHGLALIEAMALGIPVIGGINSGAVPWTLDQGRAGILVDVSSSEAVAKAMAYLAEHFQERISLGSRGKAMVMERFHIEAVADAYERIYSDLAASP